MRDINKGKFLWGCKNSRELDVRLDFIDAIIKNMKLYGYKPGFEICLPVEDPKILAKHFKLSSEITINIGRNGDFFFQDGRHRLAIAKVLNIKTVPVKILVRHKLWYDKLIKKEHFGVEYNSHPDFIYMKEKSL